jgi:MFS family permease
MLLMYSLGFFMLMSLNIKVSSGVIVRESAIKSFLHGFDYVTRHSVLFPAIGVTLVMNMFVFTHTQLLPIFAKEILLVGSTELGVMASAIGVGALIGTLIQASLGNFGHRGMVYLSGSTITILSALLFSASAWFGLSLVFLFIFGLGLSAFHSMQGAILLSAASSDMRGRTMSILMFGIGAGPVGTLIVGRMALEMGAPLAIRVSAGIGLILFLLIVISSPKLRGYS